tara:strand:+ start:1420 stop:1557 length:138 start_codon:yes stop_codon:yes gene_type:complete
VGKKSSEEEEEEIVRAVNNVEIFGKTIVKESSTREVLLENANSFR